MAEAVALLTGQDPFDAGEEVLKEFGENHPALKFLMEADFAWPSIGQGGGGTIVIDGELWHSQSPLTAMGYHVGVSSYLTDATRRNLLTKIFKGRLVFPRDFSAHEQREWGDPSSATRLRRIAEHIAGNITLHGGRLGYGSVAVKEWHSDLIWMKKQFYASSSRFRWPDTTVVDGAGDDAMAVLHNFLRNNRHLAAKAQGLVLESEAAAHAPHRAKPKPAHPSTPPSVERSPGDTLIVDLGAGVKMELVWIPPGEFDMGSRDEGEDAKPVHRVRLTHGFWMCKYEVTQEQWQRVMGNNSSGFNGAHKPVERVSWDDCQKYLTRLNSEITGQRTDGRHFRLPTEAEWEYACRAGTTTRYHNGDQEPGLGDVAWYDKNSRDSTHPVGQKKPNAWGLYDMHGNVWEWCLDWWGSYPDGSVTDPRGPSAGSGRVIRGGCWSRSAYGCRVAYRSGYPPDTSVSSVGFRAVLPPVQ